MFAYVKQNVGTGLIIELSCDCFSARVIKIKQYRCIASICFYKYFRKTFKQKEWKMPSDMQARFKSPYVIDRKIFQNNIARNSNTRTHISDGEIHLCVTQTI